MRRLFCCLRIVFVLCLAAQRVLAYDIVSSRAAGLGNAVLLSSPSASEFANLPLGGWTSGEWQIETGYNRAFELREFDQFFVAGGYHRNRLAFGAGCSQFGSAGLYLEQRAKGAISFRFDSLHVGLEGALLHTEFGGGYRSVTAAALGLGAALRFREGIVAFRVENLNSPRLADGSLPTNLQYSVLGEYRGGRSFSLLFGALFENRQRPRFSFGQWIGLLDKSALLVGISTEPLQYGGGIEFKMAGSAVSYAAAYHPVLGLTQTIAISYGRGHRAEARSHGTKQAH